MIALSETWLKGDIRDKPVIAELVPNGYCMHQASRVSRGGGVALVYKENLAMTVVRTSEWASFEVIECLSQASPPLRVSVVYRPPTHGNDFISFMHDFAEYLDHSVLLRGHLVITGDFNIHLDDAASRECIEFTELLQSFGLVQHVQQPTHKAGHLLDLVITKEDYDMRPSVVVFDQCLSDHYTLSCTLQVRPPAGGTARPIEYRNLKRVNIDAFRDDIITAFSVDLSAGDSNVDHCLHAYNDKLNSLIDKHAPLKCRMVPVRKKSEWFNDEIRQAKQQRRRSERLWRKTGLQSHREAFIECKKEVRALTDAAKSRHYLQVIDENKNDPKRIFSIMDDLLGNKKVLVLPPGREDCELATLFNDFFIEKVANIRAGIPVTSQDLPSERVDCVLDSWDPVSEEDVRKFVMDAPSKSCALDPISTSLLKQCLDALLPTITLIINKSLSVGIVPSQLKQAKVVPLIKKPSLDPSTLANYRPVSNLPFLSKVLEKVVLAQLSTHFSANELLNKMQSAYRKHHSTETALVRMQSDIIDALNQKKACLMVLLDLSAAFDTVDHEQLIKTLDVEFGVKGCALKWLQSYLTDRYQTVHIRRHCSAPAPLQSGVPQGSVLGPVLFTVYTSSLAKLLDSFAVNYHFYADDTSLYVSFEPSDIDANIDAMERCIDAVKTWMSAKQLKMNDSKSEFIVIATKSLFRQIPVSSALKVGNVVLDPSNAVKSLGVVLDKYLSMNEHVSNVCKACYYHLCNIGRIRKYLSFESCELLVNALITSRLDYCNALLYNLPNCLLNRLQRIQNCAARILTYTRRDCHITPVLNRLHWLPVVFRIRFKILLLVFKCLNGLAPVYLIQLLSPYSPSRELRSSSQLMLAQSASFTVNACRSFNVSGPRLWNSLPMHIKECSSLSVFKSKLKTHLFIECFNS